VKAGHADASINTVIATLYTATNKLLRAAQFEIPMPGRWPSCSGVGAQRTRRIASGFAL
jgi:hypothetical protein